MLLIATCFDPDEDEPVFTPDDFAVIQEKSASAVETITRSLWRWPGCLAKAVWMQREKAASRHGVPLLVRPGRAAGADGRGTRFWLTGPSPSECG